MRLALVLLLALVTARPEVDAAEMTLAGGDAQRGRALSVHYGCGSCHTIPSQSGATGRVGPPLAGISQRAYLGGRLPNTPANMMLWIRHPQAVNPRTAMPDVGLSEAEARDVSAFLYTLP